MTEEIKEILDYIDDRIIPNEKWDKIKDYITNLQQLYENGLKVNQNSHKYITELEMNNAILKEDLDKANDIIEKDRQFYKCRMDEYVDYKSRCEKANKWVNKNTEICTNKDGFSITIWDDLSDPEELKNILNGSDENE